MPNLYKVEPSSDGLTYTFTTRFNIVYKLALIAYPLGELSAFSLSLYPETETKILDFWIKNTVVKVIGDILSTDSNVIFYICDHYDDRHKTRHNVFEYWYQKSADDYAYIGKYNHTTDSQNGYELNGSVLYNNENPLKDFVIEAFRQGFEYL